MFFDFVLTHSFVFDFFFHLLVFIVKVVIDVIVHHLTFIRRSFSAMFDSPA